MKIMYVEDNTANVLLVRRVARMGGHEVINYIDGNEALDNFEGVNPDLVLMDIQLAGELTGLQVVQRIRARGSRVPIIAVTAYAMLGDKERVLEAGCDDYLPKPLPIPQLVEIFDHYARQPLSRLDTSEIPRDVVNKVVTQHQEAAKSEPTTEAAPTVKPVDAPAGAPAVSADDALKTDTDISTESAPASAPAVSVDDESMADTSTPTNATV